MSQQAIEVRKLTPTIGAEVLGVDLAADLSNSQVDTIRQAFHDNLVIFFRDQKLTIDQHKAFGQRFGKLYVHPHPRFPIDGHPEVITIKADETSEHVSGDLWHSDLSCLPEPPLGSILYMHEVPKNDGGDTMFANMYAAYEALSDRMKQLLDGLTAVHDGDVAYRGKGRNTPPDAKTPRAEHPIVRTHPETGKKCLFVNRYFTTSVAGLKPLESQGLLETLYRHMEAPEFQCRFKWRTGSMAFWDNRCAMHYAIWDYFPHRRLGHRLTLCGDKPV